MAEIPIQIPKQSIAIDEATLLEHLVEDGKRVEEGSPLFLIETEKVETEINASASGVVHWTAEVGQVYEVGTRIGHIDTGG